MSILNLFARSPVKIERSSSMSEVPTVTKELTINGNVVRYDGQFSDSYIVWQVAREFLSRDNAWELQVFLSLRDGFFKCFAYLKLKIDIVNNHQHNIN